MIYYNGEFNGIKTLAGKFWALDRGGSLLAECPLFSSLVLVGIFCGIRLWVSLSSQLWDLGTLRRFFFLCVKPCLKSGFSFLVKELKTLHGMDMLKVAQQ